MTEIIMIINLNCVWEKRGHEEKVSMNRYTEELGLSV